MIPTRQALLSKAAVAQRESKHLDFKSACDPTAQESWCELIKDIVAFANSGGGIIIFGVNDDGTPASFDHTSILECDIADITNKIAKYTGYQFGDIEILEVIRGGNNKAAFIVGAADVPMVFTKPGTYDIGGGKQKSAFGAGTLYFRHGGKSEHGTRDDLSNWKDREIARTRRQWLGGIRKVVEAPPGHTVAVVGPATASATSSTIGVRISKDGSGPPIAIQNPEEVWPHRQRELLERVNKCLPSGMRVIGHDIVCVNKRIDIFSAHPEFAYKSHHLASPQYSDQYAIWLCKQANESATFFRECREEYRRTMVSTKPQKRKRK